MFRDLFKLSSDYSVISLLADTAMMTFLLVFVSIGVYAFTRRRADIDRWSKLTLDESEPEQRHE
jgi:hypothetical protein